MGIEQKIVFDALLSRAFLNDGKDGGRGQLAEKLNFPTVLLPLIKRSLVLLLGLFVLFLFLFYQNELSELQLSPSNPSIFLHLCCFFPSVYKHNQARLQKALKKMRL